MFKGAGVTAFSVAETEIAESFPTIAESLFGASETVSLVFALSHEYKSATLAIRIVIFFNFLILSNLRFLIYLMIVFIKPQKSHKKALINHYLKKKRNCFYL